MATEQKPNRPETKNGPFPLWAGATIVILIAAVVVLLGLLAFSVAERRWEAQRPQVVVRPIAAWEPDNAVWGQNYPREYESYLKTRIDDTKTKYGGAFPRDYLEEDPYQVILFAGYGFSKEYLQARGHYHAVEDVSKTKRIKTPFNAATCWTCKSTDVPRMMNKMGVKGVLCRQLPRSEGRDYASHRLPGLSRPQYTEASHHAPGVEGCVCRDGS